MLKVLNLRRKVLIELERTIHQVVLMRSCYKFSPD